jgi:prepilin-type N-terminal cleavage/methylation domain-containing protein
MKMNNRGFSLMELAIAVGLIAILMGVVAAGGGMMAKCRVQRETEAVDNLRIASQNYLTPPNLTYTGISVAALKTAGLLPNSFDPAGANGFGGDYSVEVNSTDNTKVDIALADVPTDAATSLSSAFNAKADSTTYDNTSKLWTATF